MVAGTFTEECVAPVTTERWWKAGIRHGHTLIPQLMPEIIDSGELLEGDGGVGTLMKFNFAPASEDNRYVIDRVEVMDDDNHVFIYNVIEGGPIGTKMNSLSFEFNFESTSDEECKLTLKIVYDSKEDGPEAEAHVVSAKEGVMGMMKAVASHLQTNPDIYV